MLQISVKSMEVVILILTIRKKCWANWKPSSQMHQNTETTDNWCPEKWRDKQMPTITANWEHKAITGAGILGNVFHWPCGEWLEAQCRLAWEMKNSKAPNPGRFPLLSWVLPTGAPPGSECEERRKVPSCFPGGRRENNHFEIGAEHSDLLKKARCEGTDFIRA